MKAAIISVGTELLFGQITNTNTVYLSEQLQYLGIDVMYHHTVGDNPDRLKQLILQTYEECDLIITTGGLGPTQDDLTKEIVTETLGDELVLHEETIVEMEAYFKRLKRVMTDNNRKQAWLPSKSTILKNNQGTAPGFALEIDGKTAICLPGPPREMKAMFELQARPYLEKQSNCVIFYKMLRTFGIGESALETELEDLIDAQTDPTLATYAKEGECSLRIASKRATLAEAEAAVAETEEKVFARIGEYVYSDNDEELHEVVGKMLVEKNISISCAESCTGGMFAGTLTNVPGISKVFNRGYVTYSNEAKIDELGVPADVLDEYGAVSPETAIAMARGTAKNTGSRLAISITGIAGPDGGTEEKPVGLVYIASVFDGKELTKEIRMRNVSRKWNRNYAVLAMFYHMYQIVREA